MEQKNENMGRVKCLIWDLDNTLWQGTLAETDRVVPDPRALVVLKALDERGILQSIASKNDGELGMTKLKEHGLDTFFLYPEINWGPKSESVTRIVEALNIGMDSIAFVDDQPFEREEVAFSHPSVLCLDAADMDTLLDMPELNPRFITSDSAIRREMYRNDAHRNQLEEHYEGPKESFLASLEMIFEIAPAQEEDLRRAEELTVRTNQLNTTGITYSYEQLQALCDDKDHRLLIAGLDDKYGTYGRIGLVLLELHANEWRIKLLLMSCRVMARGVGTIMINYLKREAKAQGVALRADFVHTDRNRMMYITYKFAGFKEMEKKDKRVLLEANMDAIADDPDYVRVLIGT